MSSPRNTRSLKALQLRARWSPRSAARCRASRYRHRSGVWTWRCRSSRRSTVELLRQVFPRLRFAPERRDLVRVDPHHQVVDVIVDSGEPVTGSGGNDDDVTGLQVVGDAVSNLRTVVAGTVELANGLQRGRSTLTIRDVRPEDQRGCPADHVVDLA